MHVRLRFEGQDPDRIGAQEGPAAEADLFVPGRVSVIVPTKNSSRTIGACLSSIQAQTYRDVELIVVDNSSTDSTASIARTSADLVLTAGPERSAQRNVGAAASTGEFLVFIDSDMIVSTGLAEEVAGSFRRDPTLGALVISERSVGEGFWARCRSLEKQLYVGDWTVEAARAFLRTVFETLGGYDEGMYAGEDWDLAERVASRGEIIGRVESVTSHDEGRLSLRQDISKKFYYGRSFRRYVRKHPRNALRKFLRTGFVHKMPLLAHDPVHALGVMVMKILELVALLLGMLASVLQPHPEEHRAASDDMNGRSESKGRNR